MKFLNAMGRIPVECAMSTTSNGNAPFGRVFQALRLGAGLLALGACTGRVEARYALNTPPNDTLLLTHYRNHFQLPTETLATHVSLVVPNFARPRNVEHIVQKVVGYEVVDETLVWDVHVDPDKRPDINHPKAWVINTPQSHPREKWGLMTRFKDCVLAQNEWVLMTDDDQLLSEDAIVTMMRVKQQDPDRLVCYFGREIGEGDAPEQMHYRVWDPPAPALVPICLTKAMLTDRRFCLEALRQAPMMEDIALAGDPYWNGEDIWHALTAYHLTGKLHVLLPRDDATYTILPAPNGIGDARPGPFDHRKHRETLVQQGARRLGLNVSAMHLQPWDLEA